MKAWKSARPRIELNCVSTRSIRSSQGRARRSKDTLYLILSLSKDLRSYCIALVHARHMNLLRGDVSPAWMQAAYVLD